MYLYSTVLDLLFYFKNQAGLDIISVFFAFVYFVSMVKSLVILLYIMHGFFSYVYFHMWYTGLINVILIMRYSK